MHMCMCVCVCVCVCVYTGRGLIDSHGLGATTTQVIAVKMSLASAGGVGAQKVGPVHAAAPWGPHMQVHVL
jgi:hypothetical protein